MNISRQILRTSQLFPPTEGGEVGTCIVCGTSTRKGHRIDFSSNFTAWSMLWDGDCICEYCYTLCRDQQYRRRSWVATKQGIRFLQKSEILEVLLNPPEPPFAIYITRTGKKQGFLQLVNRLSYSREHYFIAFDDALVFVNRGELEEMVEIAKKARALKFTKAELLSEPAVHRWQHRELCEQIVKLAKKPLWEVIVYAVE